MDIGYRKATKEEEENFWREWEKLSDERWDKEVYKEYLGDGYWTIYWKSGNFNGYLDNGYDDQGIYIKIGSMWDLSI